MKQIILLLLTSITLSCNSQNGIKKEINETHDLVEEGLKAIQTEEFHNKKERLKNYVSIHASVLKSIMAKEDEILTNASSEISEKMSQILNEIELTVRKIETAHGLDENGQIKNKGETKLINKILLIDGEAKELRRKILRNINTIKSILNQNNLKVDETKITLTNSLKVKEKSESWEEYYFKNMPAGAVMPIFNHLQNEAKITNLNILEEISNMNI